MSGSTAVPTDRVMGTIGIALEESAISANTNNG